MRNVCGFDVGKGMHLKSRALNRAVVMPTPTLKKVISTRSIMAEGTLACSASDCTEKDLNSTTAVHGDGVVEHAFAKHDHVEG